MRTYSIARTYKTGIEKPHTIELENGRKVSVIYYDSKYIPSELTHIANAIDENGTKYQLFASTDTERILAKRL